MCLGGGGSDYQYQEPVRYDPCPGPESPPDMVNDKTISNTGNYNREQLKGDVGMGRGKTLQSDRSRGG